MLATIMEMCEAQGMTLAELERKSGIAPRTIYKWDDSVPSVEKVYAVANALGTTVDELMKAKKARGEAECHD